MRSRGGARRSFRLLHMSKTLFDKSEFIPFEYSDRSSAIPWEQFHVRDCNCLAILVYYNGCQRDISERAEAAIKRNRCRGLYPTYRPIVSCKTFLYDRYQH